MKIRSKPMKHGTYRHFRRQADGSLVFVGDVDYAYPAESLPEHSDADRAEELARRDADEAEVLGQLREQFENWVDAACEGE